MMKLVEPKQDFDGLNQSWFTEILWSFRFRQCRRRVIQWRLDAEAFERAVTVLPRLGDFGDRTYATAQVSGQTWIVRERFFHGWPDPPRFAFFSLEDNRLWAAADFADWPVAWRWEEGPHEPEKGPDVLQGAQP